MRALLLWLSSRMRLRVIDDESGPYLERYYVCSALGHRVYLHRFVASDPDRGLHDHPWAWAVSLILSGWYREERRSGLNEVHWFNFLVGDNFHRVVLPEGRSECWTLFIHRSGNRKPWGFMREFPNEHTLLWHAYTYPAGQQSEERRWWLTAPLGRDEPRRVSV